LTGFAKKVEFVSWLFAQNRQTKERRYIKWIRWHIDFEITFDFTKTPPETITVWKAESIEEGDGMGPTPVDIRARPPSE